MKKLCIWVLVTLLYHTRAKKASVVTQTVKKSPQRSGELV